MLDVATLYVRNIPADLYEELRRWAEEHDRSVNAEVIDVLRRESERRRQDDEFALRLAAYYEKWGDQPVTDYPLIEWIREGRDRDLDPDADR
jgi:plasmid stability protein